MKLTVFRILKLTTTLGCFLNVALDREKSEQIHRLGNDYLHNHNDQRKGLFKFTVGGFFVFVFLSHSLDHIMFFYKMHDGKA